MDFHATLSAQGKLYRYVIDNGVILDPFQTRYSLHVPHPLDEKAMDRASKSLLGTHDFRGFETNYPNRTTSIRTITHISVDRGGRFVWLEVAADGFLYNMVRAIAGTLILVGSGRWGEERVAEVLGAQDRRATGPTAPPQGLFLVRVDYEPDPKSLAP